MVCQECTTEDHVSVCHVPHTPNSDFTWAKLSTLTGTIVVTEASRPVPKNKSMEVTSTTNSTSTKSTRNTSLTATGTDKSTKGALRLLLVLKKSSFASTQDTTKTQHKVKSNWERCLASRKSKLSVFTTCLYGKRTHQRA